MSWLLVVLAFVAFQRLAELAWSAHATRALRARGGIEHGHRHYPLFVLLHGGWWLALLLVVPWDRQPSWPLLAAFLALQPLRLWIIASLGRRWTTRVIVLPGAPRVATGPYRWLRHPNYLLVTLELALLPLAFGAPLLALIVTVANLPLLAHRIRIEEAALAAASGGRGDVI